MSAAKLNRVTRQFLDYQAREIAQLEKELIQRYPDAYYNEIDARQKHLARLRADHEKDKRRFARYK